MNEKFMYTKYTYILFISDGIKFNKKKIIFYSFESFTRKMPSAPRRNETSK